MIKQKLKVFLLIFLFSIFLNTQVFAESMQKNEIQSKCFNTLKSNLSEIWIFEKPYSYIKNISYENINFSRYYKNMSSFWIDLDKSLFEMRLYSFWKQTWYIHPPYSPFAVSTKSEKWDSASKEYIIAEEYITKPDWTKQFLSCSFMQISSDNLMKVTSDNYLYDWEIISLLKEDKNLDYKAWYNENVSYNYENKIFATWNRLFIYPKETQNNYFDRYKIASSFPTNISTNFDALKKQEIPDKKVWDWQIRIYMQDENWKVKKQIAPKELSSVEQKWNNEIFPLFWYYQDIENTFPDFAKNIALRWELHFDTLKEIIGTKDNAKYAHIWNTILDSRGFTKYTQAKQLWKEKDLFQKWEIDFYEKNLSLIGKFEEEIRNIENKAKEDNINKYENSNYNNWNWKYYIIIIFLLFILISFWIIFYKRKK